MKKLLLLSSSALILFLCFFTFAAGANAAETSNLLLPTSDGFYTSWDKKPPSSSPQYQRVDETVCNGEGDYIYSTSPGEKSSFKLDLSTIPDGAIIEQISITPCASQHAGNTKKGNATIDVFYRLDSVDSTPQGNYDVFGSRTPDVLSQATYSSLNITKDENTDLEVGAVLESGSRGGRLSQIVTQITYSIPQPPSVETEEVFDVDHNSAHVSAVIDGKDYTGTANFRYSTVNSSCQSLSQVSNSTSIGPGETHWFNFLSQLEDDTTYYYCATATTQTGTTYGNVLSFTTDKAPVPPSVTTDPVTSLSSSSAILNTTINPNGFSTNVSFNYGTKQALCENLTNSTQTANIGSGSSSTSYSDFVSGLSPKTTYYHCAQATNSLGTSYSQVLNFTTLP